MTHDPSHRERRPLILLTGATGYVGGRLLKRLEAEGHRLRCLVRRPDRLQGIAGPHTELTPGDALKPDTLERALEGVHTAYYLIHSMGSSGAFEDEDRRAALNFAQAARSQGVRRIIYLGGLGEEGHQLSAHLKSRQQVGEVLRASGVEVVEFRASIVIGAGSFSFEMLRALVERLPVMVTPKWVSTPAQPIASDDLIDYLLEALELPEGGSRIFEIGGADKVSYGDCMSEYARQRGLRRLMVPVPVLTPWLSSLWLGLVTPLYASVGRHLIESIRHPTVARDDTALRAFKVKPKGIREAIDRALEEEDHRFAQTRWSVALVSQGKSPGASTSTIGTRIIESRAARVSHPASAAFRPIERIGGKTGWYYGNSLWRLRGLADRLLGGVGLRRGRRDPNRLAPGDTLDCWKVEALEPDRLLRLKGEMKLPGRAWLQFEVDENDVGAAIRQTAIFDPRGLLGLIYWYSLHPIHKLMFAGMLRAIAEAIDSKS